MTDYVKSNVTALKNAVESLSDGLIIAMVLKGLYDTFNPFSIYVTHSSKELTFLEFKTQLRNLEDADKYRHNSNNDNVKKFIFESDDKRSIVLYV